jgi:hypothetical protein
MTHRMHVRLLVSLIAAASVGLSAGHAFGQTPALGAVARKEQERRKTTSPPKKILTNADLPKVSAPAATPSAAQAPASGTDPASGAAPHAPEGNEPVRPEGNEPAKPEGDKTEKGEAYWRGRIGAARQQLQSDEVLLAALQARVNALAGAFAARDDPSQRAQIGDDRRKAIAELERVQAEIVQLKQQIEDIEEEARRAGVPPGWLR